MLTCKFDLLGELNPKYKIEKLEWGAILLTLLFLLLSFILDLLVLNIISVVLWFVIFSRKYIFEISKDKYPIIGEIVITAEDIVLDSQRIELKFINKISFEYGGYKEDFDWFSSSSPYTKITDGTNNKLTICTDDFKRTYRFQINTEQAYNDLTDIIKVWKYLGYDVGGKIFL